MSKFVGIGKDGWGYKQHSSDDADTTYSFSDTSTGWTVVGSDASEYTHIDKSSTPTTVGYLNNQYALSQAVGGSAAVPSVAITVNLGTLTQGTIIYDSFNAIGQVTAIVGSVVTVMTDFIVTPQQTTDTSTNVYLIVMQGGVNANIYVDDLITVSYTCDVLEQNVIQYYVKVVKNGDNYSIITSPLISATVGYASGTSLQVSANSGYVLKNKWLNVAGDSEKDYYSISASSPNGISVAFDDSSMGGYGNLYEIIELAFECIGE